MEEEDGYDSDTTKNVLTASTYIHLKCNGFGKYASDLPSVSPRILLSGPAGSEIYQETLCKAASSVDAEITGGSTLSSQATLKQEVSTASSKGTTLKIGDRVKFVGNLPSAFSSLQSCPSRGPSYGSQGKVLMLVVVMELWDWF